MSRNVPGAFGRPRGRRALPLVIALVLIAACSPAAIHPVFSLSIRNSGEAPVRLKVIVASQSSAPKVLVIAARSGILQTAERPMDVKDGKPDPVVVEVYTDTCALVGSVTVGEGRTRIDIGPDFAITATGGAPNNEGAVEPELVDGC